MQVWNLQKLGIPAKALSSQSSKEEVQEIQNSMASSSDLRLLYGEATLMGLSLLHYHFAMLQQPVASLHVKQCMLKRSNLPASTNCSLLQSPLSVWCP